MAKSIVILAVWSWLFACAAYAQDASGLQNGVTLTGSSPLATNAEIVRRLFSPLTAQHIAQALVQSGKTLSGQPVDPRQEKFTLYVPAEKPANGYALVVFVPPSNEAKLPSGWAAALDQYGAIFVSAANSGNDANVIERRVPLALLAAQNVMQRYAVDPEHVYIAGFSGGARVALRLALAYPDLFRGALLEAGSDPIATAGMPLPPKDLFARFQDASRIVFMTGEHDGAALSADAATRTSLRKLCISGVQTENIPDTAHAIASGAALSRGLKVLFDPPARRGSDFASCRAALDAELDTQFGEAETLLTRGNRDEAKNALDAIDVRFGGLAAPRSLELLSRLR
ncbi:MAG TPA: PHB depolymerase family esterase [Paraburkholderia sp.]|nr:PHB depolymerase family esterase [Paraburkholderia sp.]